MAKKIGEILVESGAVTESVIEDAVNNKKSGQKIGDYLVQKGFLSEDILYERLSKQLKIPLYNLKDHTYSRRTIDLLDKETLKKYVCFPVDLTGSLLNIAMEDPVDEEVVRILEDIVGLEINPVLAKKSGILDYIDKYYNIDDSMLVNFGVGEGDIDEASALETLFSEAQNRDVKIVLSALDGKVKVLHSNIEEYNRIYGHIYKVINKEVKGISEGYVDKTYKYKNVELNLSVLVQDKGDSRVIWIYISKNKNKEDVKERNNIKIEETGLYVLCNKEFKRRKELIENIVGIDKNIGDVLVYTRNMDVKENGLSTYYGDKENLDYISNFFDVFVFDLGWEEDIDLYVLSLLSNNKTVLIQLPYDMEESKEFILNKRELLHSLVVDYVKI